MHGIGKNPSGYDCNFISEPDHILKCLICLSVARDPRQHEECGKLFCSECIEKYGTKKPCPNCKKRGSHFYKDHRSKRDIAELKVKCDNIERKCKWVGTIDTLEEHLAKCRFTLLPCPKECKDADGICYVMRKDLNIHLKRKCPHRDFTCKHCREKGTYADISTTHDLKCPKKPIPCPEGCNITMPRKRVLEHVTTECELSVTPCKYKRLGCSTELKRKDMAAHEEDDKLHLRMAMDTTVKLHDLLERSKSFHFKLTNYHTRKDENETVRSPCHYISLNGYRMYMRVNANGDDEGKNTHVLVFVHIVKGDYDDQLKWPFIGTITITLFNRLEDKNHYVRTMNLTQERDLRVGWGRGYNKFIAHSELDYDPVNNTQYLKDDTLHFKVSASAEESDHKPWLE